MKGTLVKPVCLQTPLARLKSPAREHIPTNPSEQNNLWSLSFIACMS
jgi:hypothetical protein